VARSRLDKFHALSRQYQLDGEMAMDHDQLHDAIRILRHCRDIRLKLLRPYHHDIARVEDALGKALALSGSMGDAIIHVTASIAILQRLFGDSSVEVAREYMKLADLCINNGDKKQAITVITKAIPILNVYGCHSQVTDLEQMMKHLR
jgi:hypothetical protein